MGGHGLFISPPYCATHKNAGSPAARRNERPLGRRQQIGDITACRALFATWVFVYHLDLQLGRGSFGPLAPLVGRGYLGVDGFFLLSGLILAYAHPDLGGGPADLARFWVKRLLRIYPVHLAMIALLALMLAAGTGVGLPPRDPGRFGGGELVRHLLLVHGWGLSGRWAWNYPSWSISTEWAGYLAFPFLWLGMMRLSPAVCVPVSGAMLGLLVAVDHSAGLNLSYEGALARFFPEFVAGMAATRIATLFERRMSGAWLVLAGVGAFGAALLWLRDWAVVAALWLALAGLLVAARQGRGPALARLPGLLWLGGLSYAFYMSFGVIETFEATIWRQAGIAPAERPVTYVVSATVLTLALAAAASRFVERPALRLGRLLAAHRPDR